MKGKRIWMGLLFAALLTLCALLVFSRAGESAPEGGASDEVELILPPQTPAPSESPVYDDLPDVDLTSWEYLFVNASNAIGDYAPPEVVAVGEGNAYFDSRAAAALEALLQGARDAGYTPYVYCGYRSYATQRSQFENETALYTAQGYPQAEAEQLAARTVAAPGTSEHQTGLSADVVDGYYTSLSTDKVDAAFMQWLHDHCAEYGFVLRFPEGKEKLTGRYEPWHVRYVGAQAAAFIMEHELCMEEFVALYGA